MRALLLAAFGLAALPVSAQTFRLVDPALTVGGTRVGVVGAPLVQEPFGQLALVVPGEGTYRVSDTPFDGSRAVGQFDGDGLYFALDGQSVRLRSTGPILNTGQPTPAHVRFDPEPSRSARGLARVSVSDAPGDATPSSASPVQTVALQRGPTSPAPTTDARADALRDALARATAERAALVAERDRLRAGRDASRTSPGWSATRETALAQAVARAGALDAETARLPTERDQRVASGDRATAERADLASQLEAARLRAETASTPAQAALAEGDVARLRADIVARDEAVAALRTESDDRRIRLTETDAEFARGQRSPAERTAERDVTRRNVDAIHRAAPAGRTALGIDPASLDADRAAPADARFGADRADAPQNPASVSPHEAARLADRQQSLDALAAVQRERDGLQIQVTALQADRDRLTSSVDRLTSDLAAERRRATPIRTERPDRAARPVAIPPPAAPVPAPRHGTASFPGFDMERLANPDVVRRRLDEAEYPYWAAEGEIAGDVLVLFQTDPSGRVIRTAVATPIGGGLDGLAESLVRDMQLVPPVVDGQSTGLRSQILVRFER